LEFCLHRIGSKKPGWKTLFVTASATTNTSPEGIWQVWTQLERWPTWSPLHRSVRWTNGSAFELGAEFDQELQLGFPLGVKTGHVSIDVLDPARRVSWKGVDNGVKSCHVWVFEPHSDETTLVTSAEVFDGTAVALMRPAVARRWRNAYQAAVDNLIRATEATRDESNPK
jgi:hypothetical protein